MITHVPPKGHQDIIYTQESVGSESLNSIVEKKKPLFHFFGHCHELNPGYSVNKNTLFVNAANCLGSASSTNRRIPNYIEIYNGPVSKQRKNIIFDTMKISKKKVTKNTEN